eukprot:GFKZ01006710.1.p1 GENE.GFKZ01006710.1~~GFKZ01006710.1.p1  ORF type:complete len:674 (+),score=82.59 GFKZ01006710.1:85-2106(+)
MPAFLTPSVQGLFISRRLASPLTTPHRPPCPSPSGRLHSVPSAQLPDVIIVGAGIASLSTAFELSQSGTSVTLYHTPTRPPAALAAAGMIAPHVEEMPQPLQSLALLSHAMYPQFLSRLSNFSSLDVSYVSRGDFIVPYFADEDSTEADLQGSERVQLVEPALSKEVVAARRVREEAHIDNRRLVAALKEACQGLGVQIKEGLVKRVLVSPNGTHVDGLVMDGEGLVRAGHYVFAGGAWSKGLLPDLPVRPIKGQMLSLRYPNDTGGNTHELTHTLFGRGLYVVPKQARGEFYVGATMEEGIFELRNTASGIASLLQSAVRLVPGFGECEIAETWSGLRPTTPDLMPVLGSAEYKNASIATGYYRNGILLAPVTAKIAAMTAMGAVDSLSAEIREILPSFSMQRFFNGSSKGKTSTAAGSRGNGESAGKTGRSSPNDIRQPGGDSSGVPKGEKLLYKISEDGVPEPVEPSEGFMQRLHASSRQGSLAQKINEPRLETPGPVPAPESPSSPSMSESMDSSFTTSEYFARAEARGRVADKSISGINGDGNEYGNDAYEDVMQYRGPEEDTVMNNALEKNRAFGRKQSKLETSDGRNGPSLSLTDEEVGAFDEALAQGLKDMEEAAKSFGANHPSRVATQMEGAALMGGKDTTGINGAEISGRGDRPDDYQSEGYF